MDMKGFQKEFVVAGSLAMAALLVLGAWLMGMRQVAPALTVKARRVTSGPASDSSAAIDLTLTRPAVVNLHAFECKVDDQWLEAPVPKLLSDEFETMFSVQAALSGRCTGLLHGATNSPWRVTFEVVEPRTGWAGFKERLQKPTGYRRAGGWLNVLFGTRPVRYTGMCYFVQTEEIGR